ncbi:MAG: putative portal protein [Prokaryotic dsDNA virus sp.]|uniref:hypothetical protein n=2 Tax=Thalassospira sp. TaxID=1912094 RepID=UPI000C640A18|nr:hypothetical protein [Thalassospira sp.]MAZ33878.1 hypothetical protein [Thalassospira sp.]MAZ34629.1 hypothetical protein [Thalassospira sp.]QDP60991.1 MAG: putative portal protein [Prokaryotic dsDNA virus sp.]QDP64504.1 MAG: putative portal protein [Prokaryotic dsDNA virus sp.]
MARTIDLREFVDPETMAADVAMKWTEWDTLRENWLESKQEVQEYLFATNTTTTSNSSLPWKNKVHIPKLCQIRDNLHANYMATLFPNDKSIVWEGADADSATKEKRKTIQAYMQNKLRQTKFRTEVSRLVLDYIDCGNCFAMPVFEASYQPDPDTGEEVPSYVGPRLQRIAPEDITFDPTTAVFENAPKIIRSLKTLGTLKKEIATRPELGYMEEVFEKSLDVRRRFSAYSSGDFKKNSHFQYAGFTGFWEYFNSDYIEVLDFYGDYYDVEEDKLYENYLITVVDRAYVLRKKPLENWMGHSAIRHCGWRQRQDNLYAMGPLDNLLGLQYRIDHLENCKSDAWDMYVHPMPLIKGEVSDFQFGPDQRVYADVDGDVTFLRPDASFLNADTQIEMYERKMEEMAGAPKEAVGFRTPGEKTAFEVQVLENGANKVFINKVSYFEEMFLEPLLNDMLMTARRNLNESDLIRVMDDETQAQIFRKITKEDLTATGKLRPMGARHFAQNATIMQNIVQFANSPLAQDPTINSHISGKKMATVIQTLLGLEDYNLVQDNVRLYEMAELQDVQGSLEQAMLEKQTAGMDPNQAAATVQGYQESKAGVKPSSTQGQQP